MQFSLIPVNYHNVMQTKFAAGGQGIDMMFANSGYAEHWYKSGWTRAINGLPGLGALNADIDPQGLKADNFSISDHKQIAIPYYTGIPLFVYNKDIVSKNNIAIPTTWDEFTAACTKLQQAGITHPFAAFWDADSANVGRSFFTHCASEGLKSLFTDKLEPTYDTSPIALEVLERWVGWFKQGIVSPSVLTSDYTGVAGLFNSGQAAFSQVQGQFVKPWATTKGTPVYGNTAIAMLPGKTHATFTEMAQYLMAAKTPDPQATWELMKYLAWRDVKSKNRYVVPIGYLEHNFGLTAPYKGALESPLTRKELSYVDYDILRKQTELAENLMFPADHAPWFTGWYQTALGTALQSAIIGKTPPATALKVSADYVRAHRK